MDRIASGGERISRIALALKTCVIGVQKGPLRTLVFDDRVDTEPVMAPGPPGRRNRRLKQLASVNPECSA
jgi:hypothetical protein